MKLSLHWKIATSFTVLTALVLLVLGAYLRGVIRQDEIGTVRDQLLSEARLAAHDFAPPWIEEAALQRRVGEWSARSGSRVTLIGSDGRVVADSERDPATMENHADRAERLQALAQGSGFAVRESETLKLPMLYAAVALPTEDDEHPAVVRLAQPLSRLAARLERLRRVMLIGLIASTTLIWGMSLLLARGLVSPVHDLVRVARRVDRGDLQARVEGVREPELAELAQVFNAALDSLSALLESSQRESRYYAAILRQMSDAVVIVDRQGRVQFINSAFARLFHIDESWGEGRSSEQIALNYELSALLLRAVQQNAVQHDEVRVLYPEPRSLATVVGPLLNEQGEIIGAVGLLHDVTDLQRLDEVRREFVANASHELRTPAAGIKALAEALQVGALRDPEKGPRFVQQIVDAADRLTRILDDMLILTRVERGRQLFNPETVPAAKAVAEAVEQIRLAAEGREVRVTAEVGESDRLTADLAGLHTVLLNLLDNAVKYTPAGGAVRVEGRAVPGGYQFTVSDTGVGIPPDQQSRIFERFYRVDKARDRATGGTGLGLAIVKHIAEAHGGRVTVSSVPGEGSVFTVFFPG